MPYSPYSCSAQKWSHIQWWSKTLTFFTTPVQIVAKNPNDKKVPQNISVPIGHNCARQVDETATIMKGPSRTACWGRESSPYQSSGQQCSAMLGCTSYQTLSWCMLLYLSPHCTCPVPSHSNFQPSLHQCLELHSLWSSKQKVHLKTGWSSALQLPTLFLWLIRICREWKSSTLPPGSKELYYSQCCTTDNDLSWPFLLAFVSSWVDRQGHGPLSSTL